MQIVVANNYDAISRQAAERIAAAASQRPDLLLAAASGMTPSGSYERLSELHRSDRTAGPAARDQAGRMGWTGHERSRVLRDVPGPSPARSADDFARSLSVVSERHARTRHGVCPDSRGSGLVRADRPVRIEIGRRTAMWGLTNRPTCCSRLRCGAAFRVIAVPSDVGSRTDPSALRFNPGNGGDFRAHGRSCCW